ncbi:hypothetical protein D3C87_2177060 [compost metagenome]
MTPPIMSTSGMPYIRYPPSAPTPTIATATGKLRNISTSMAPKPIATMAMFIVLPLHAS